MFLKEHCGNLSVLPLNRSSCCGYFQIDIVIVHKPEDFLRHRVLPHGRERLAMERGWPELAQRSQVLRSAVPFVRSEPVSWKHRVPRAHDAVALNFRKNGSRRDRGGERVPVNDRNLWLLAVDA